MLRRYYGIAHNSRLCYEIDVRHRCRHDHRHRPPDAAAPDPPHHAAAHRAVDWRLRFAVLSLVWGFSFLLIKVGTEGYAPFQVTLGRLLFGTAGARGGDGGEAGAAAARRCAPGAI